jgi:hypothetical protein
MLGSQNHKPTGLLCQRLASAQTNWTANASRLIYGREQNLYATVKARTQTCPR